MSEYQSRLRHCLLYVLAAAMCSLPVFAGEDSAATEEETKTLTIGSKAPSLDIEHWFSLGSDHEFDKVTDFEEGKVYIVEFWATWCGPCIRSMPHLVETQECYAKDGVQIVSVSDEDRGTVEKFLKREVRQSKPTKENDDEEVQKQTYAELTSAYCLTADPDRSVHDSYMKAAAQNGIPTSFVVGKTGLIEWIGHPMSIDKPLQAIVDDEWERSTFAVEFKEKQTFALMIRKVNALVRGNEFDEALGLLSEAKKTAKGRNKQTADAYFERYYGAKLKYMTKNGDGDDALKIIEADLEEASEVDEVSLQKLRVEMLIKAERSEDAAELLAELLPKLDAEILNAVAWSIYELAEKHEGKFNPALLAVAIKAAEAGVEKSDEKTPVMDTLAHLVYLQGDVERAFEIQVEAVKISKRGWPSVKAFLEKLKKELPDARDDPTEGEPKGDEEEGES